MPVMPWIENSSRTLLGRLFSCTTTASNPPLPVNLPARRSDCSACMRAMPPDAWTYFAMRLSTDCAESGVAHSVNAASLNRMLRMVPPTLQRGDGENSHWSRARNRTRSFSAHGACAGPTVPQPHRADASVDLAQAHHPARQAHEYVLLPEDRIRDRDAHGV